jgi:hypothetical protein
MGGLAEKMRIAMRTNYGFGSSSDNLKEQEGAHRVRRLGTRRDTRSPGLPARRMWFSEPSLKTLGSRNGMRPYANSYNHSVRSYFPLVASPGERAVALSSGMSENFCPDGKSSMRHDSRNVGRGERFDQIVLTYSMSGMPRKSWIFPDGEKPNPS